MCDECEFQYFFFVIGSFFYCNRYFSHVHNFLFYVTTETEMFFASQLRHFPMLVFTDVSLVGRSMLFLREYSVKADGNGLISYLIVAYFMLHYQFDNATLR